MLCSINRCSCGVGRDFDESQLAAGTNDLPNGGWCVDQSGEGLLKGGDDGFDGILALGGFSKFDLEAWGNTPCSVVFARRSTRRARGIYIRIVFVFITDCSVSRVRVCVRVLRIINESGLRSELCGRR